MGLRGKNSRGKLVQVYYLAHILEINPWPPSQSQRSLRSVFVQWRNGDRNSGTTNLVIPSVGSVISEGKIEFNASFKLNVTLLRDMSVKDGDDGRFEKNFLELHLYEPQREKTSKGQLLATATIDLADYGILKETISVCSPMNCKRSYGNTTQPFLFLKIQPIDKNLYDSSLRFTLSREFLLDDNVGESVSALMNEEYAEEAEIVSFTDDDISSHLSSAVSSSRFESNGSLQPHQIRHEKLDENSSFSSSMDLSADGITPLGPDTSDIHHQIANDKCGDTSSRTSSVDLLYDLSNPENDQASISRSPNCSSHHQVSHYTHLSPSSVGCDNMLKIPNISIRRNDNDFLNQVVYEKFSNGITINEMTGGVQLGGNHCTSNSYSIKEAFSVGLPLVVGRPVSLSGYDLVNNEVNGENEGTDKVLIEGCETMDTVRDSSVKVNYWNVMPSDMRSLEGNKFVDSEVVDDPASVERQENNSMNGIFLGNERSKHVRSVRSPADSTRKSLLSTPNSAVNIKINKWTEGTSTGKDLKNPILDRKILQLEDKINMLEGELREAAAIEAALYSVVDEHGSSISKIHAPARRLSRLYLHAHKENLHKRAGAARSAISGLILVAKACGNDVPRLTFWLSNAIMLRTILCQTTEDSELSVAHPSFQKKDEGKKNVDGSSLPKCKASSPQNKNKRISFGDLRNWEDYPTFISSLEKVESWIFTRIVDSIWWQTLIPHMQPVDQKAHNNGKVAISVTDNKRLSSYIIEEQENFPLDLWNKAFRDAYERLCPIRAGGHECGCLPVLAKLVMEQCVARLDVAMFNAILRESAQDIPTDPISDPITDAMVLPIPTGKSSFGAGAQLKNAIGNWSRWLSYEFGMDDADSLEETNVQNGVDDRQHSSLKSFFFLNTLSDLLMLPKDMLLSRSIRKEVCPNFGVTLIKRILYNFVPDEFCPDPIPKVVLKALDEEDQFASEAETVINFPCTAAPIVYTQPSAVSIISIMGGVGGQCRLRRSGSSVVSKSNTSDDELDELKSPFASIFFHGSRSLMDPAKSSLKVCEYHNANPLRYELLRDMWMNSD